MMENGNIYVPSEDQNDRYLFRPQTAPAHLPRVANLFLQEGSNSADLGNREIN
jgi:hypothetical protein